MKVLVTGATGFIGYALCQALTQGGFEVVASVRRMTGNGSCSESMAESMGTLFTNSVDIASN